MMGLHVKNGVSTKLFSLFLLGFLLTFNAAKAQLVGGNTYPINGTQNAPTSFGTVADAFTYLNANGTSGTGTITLEIAAGYPGESTTIPALNAYTGMHQSRPIILKPASGQNPTIATAPAANSAVIRFNGTRFFTIDGSNNGSTSRNLTITTTSATTTVRLVDYAPTATSSCKRNTVKNVTLRGNSTTAIANTYAAIYLGSGTATPGAALTFGNDSNLFENNLIEAVRNGIFIRGTNTAGQYDIYNRVLKNTIGGTIAPGGSLPTTYFGGVSTVSGIYLNSQQGAIIDGNLVRNSVQGYYYARGIHLDALAAAGAANKDITINANTIHSLVYSGTGGYADHGIRVQINNNTANNINITNNFIYNIAADGDNSGTFDYGVAAIQIASNAASAHSGAGVNIYHNSINLYDNGTQKLLTRTSLIATCINMQTNISGGVKVVNNAFRNSYPASTPGNAKALIYHAQHATLNPLHPSNGGLCSNNTLYVNGSNNTNVVARVASTDYTTFANWTALGVEANSKYLDPQYVANNDLHTLSFDLDLAGTPVGVTKDIDGVTRSLTKPDIGASEYVPPRYNISLERIVSLNTGCNLGTKTVKAVIRNKGVDTIFSGDTIAMWYRVNGGAYSRDSIFISSMWVPGDSMQFSFTQPANFSAFGNYTVVAGFYSTKDQFSGNDSGSTTLSNFNCLNTTPFVADFESGTDGFTETGGGWVLGAPAKTNINTAGSGNNAWVSQGLTGQYSNNMSAYLYTPLFDFSTACQPSLTWLMRFELENNYDAVIVEASTDNVNWTKLTGLTPAYNNASANGPVAPPKFSGNNNSWQRYTADLAAYKNAPLVRFRFLMGTDGSVTTYDGAAIDSVAVEFYPPLGTLSVLSGLQNDTGFIQAPYTFSSSTKGRVGVEHRWYLDNVLVDSLNGEYSTSWMTNSTHEIKLIAATCAEKDTIIIPIEIVTPIGLPTIDFIANKYVAGVGDNIKITSLTGNGAFAWTWLITPDIGFDYISQIPAQNYSFIAPTSTTTPDADLFFYLGDKFDVCLIAENVNGIDTLCKKEYLTVHNQFDICGYSSVPFPTGKVFDSGLGNANYADNDNCTSAIEPECADTIFLKLNKLVTEFNADFLRIYDGDETTGTPLWDANLYPNGLSGNLTQVLNLSSTMVATQGRVTVVFTADGANVAEGFEIEYWSVNATQKSAAAFAAPDTFCTSTDIVVKNNTNEEGYTRYYWDIDADNVDDYFTKDLDFQYTTPGNYTIRLVATNCIGSDTIYKSIVIQNPSVKPATNFAADITNPGVGDFVHLSNTTPGCVQGFSWIITPNTFSYRNGTGASSANPELVFNAPGCYNVTLITWNGVGYDTLVRTCYFNVKTICKPFVSQLNSDIGISRMKLNTIDNQSVSGSSAYTNYTNMYSTELILGGVYELTLERPTTKNTMSRKAWIDYNQDGTFDASEVIATETNASTLVFKANFKVSKSVPTGYTRLRVGAAFSNNSPNACGSNFVGEFEDYRIIIIRDEIKPVITLIGSNPIAVERGRVYTEPGATALDNIDGDISANIVITGAVNTMAVGSYTISYNVSDSTGNAATTVTRTVLVTPDVTKPDVTLNGNAQDTIIVFSSYTDLGATATDIVDGNLTSAILVSGAVDTAKVGTYTLTYSVTDASGNTGTISRFVTVLDTAKPVIVLLGNNPLIWAVDVPYVDPGHQVIDNYDTSLVATITGTVDEKVTGTYQLFFNVTDNSGANATTVIRDVVVSDTIKPVVTIIGPSVVEMDVFTSYYEFGSSATDNYDKALGAVSVVGAVDTAVVGDYDLKYVITDSENNTSDSVIRTVRVLDRVAPVVIVHNPIVIERTQAKPSLADSVDYTDNYYPKAALTLNITESIDVNVEGYYTVEYTVTDPSGNTSTVGKGLVVVKTATGIMPAVINDAAVKVYPNPTTEKAYVSMEFIRETSATISVYNMIGQKVLEVSPEGNFQSKVVELDLQHLNAGNYIIRVQGADGVANKKLAITN